MKSKDILYIFYSEVVEKRRFSCEQSKIDPLEGLPQRTKKEMEIEQEHYFPKGSVIQLYIEGRFVDAIDKIWQNRRKLETRQQFPPYSILKN